MPTSPLVRLRALCRALPETHEVEAWGAPTFRVRNKLFAMYAAAGNHHGDGRAAVWIKAPPGNQALMVRDAPDRFFVPAYVGPSGWVGVWLDGSPDWNQVGALLRDGWRMTAPKTLVAQVDATPTRSPRTASAAPAKSVKPSSARKRGTSKTRGDADDAERRLAAFMDRYTPGMVKVASAVRRAMRRRLPNAVEMVYDNYNGLVIGYGPSERASEAIFSILMLPKHVTLCFLQGATLPDPDGILRGSGNVVRNIRLDDGAATLVRPEVSAMIDRALERAKVPMDPTRKRTLVIKSVSPKQRPRRPRS